MTDEIDESAEDAALDEDMEPGLDEDLEEDMTLDEPEEDELEEAPSSRRNRYSDESVATAVRANPKRRQAARRKTGEAFAAFADIDMTKEADQLKVWVSLNEQAESTLAKAYSLHGEFVLNDSIEHPKFGLGFVLEEISSTKIAVLFEDGLKKLVFNLPE